MYTLERESFIFSMGRSLPNLQKKEKHAMD